MLSEISHKKTNTLWFHSYAISTIANFIEIGNRIVFAREKERNGKLLNGNSVSVLQYKNVNRAAQQSDIVNTTELYS